MRNTPALAGTTRAAAWSTLPVMEHPRAGGDDSLAAFPVPVAYGTPPRWRGRLHAQSRGDGRRRNTPALAGTTFAAMRSTMRRREHPRAGGDDGHTSRSSQVAGGTPPRWRGRRPTARFSAAHVGNTPALAGTTCARSHETHGCGEHPRAGGDDLTVCRTTQTRTGTPPRWRGRQAGRVSLLLQCGNTPALAGTTTAAHAESCGVAEHPRAGGDDLSRVRHFRIQTGTPPRWRGRLT